MNSERNYQRLNRDFSMWNGMVLHCARVLGSFDALADEINKVRGNYAGEDSREILGAHFSLIISGQRKFQKWLKFAVIDLAAELGWNPLSPIEKASTYAFLKFVYPDFSEAFYLSYFKKVSLSEDDRQEIQIEISTESNTN